jgi:hypothetical protein
MKLHDRDKVDGLPHIPVHERPWPGVAGPSIEHEIGARGMAARVRVIVGEKPPALISWRDGRYASIEEAERMVSEIQEAVLIARMAQAEQA